MRLRSLSAVTLLALGFSCALGRVSAQEAAVQEEAPSQFEHIQGLTPFVGLWASEAAEEDGEEGLAIFCRWSSNRSYLRLQVMPTSALERRQGQRPRIIGTMLIGKDHVNDQVSIWGFWNDRQVHGKVEVGEGTAKIDESGVMYDGRKASNAVSMKIEDDKLVIDVTDIKIGDETQPDMHFTLLKRQARRGDQTEP